MHGLCYHCLEPVGRRLDTCPSCGYHRRTVHRTDGKRGVSRNTPEQVRTVRANLQRLYTEMREKS